MTPMQVRALDFVRRTIAATGCSPTLEEIGDFLGTVKSVAWRVVDCLVREGALVRVGKLKRGLALPDQPRLTVVPTEALITELKRRARLGEFKGL